MTTIIRPNEHHTPWGFLCSIAVVLFFGMAVAGIFFYNDIVNLQHQLDDRLATITSIETENVELKNRLYQMLDGASLPSIASRMGLVEVRQPEYLEIPAAAKAVSRVP